MKDRRTTCLFPTWNVLGEGPHCKAYGREGRKAFPTATQSSLLHRGSGFPFIFSPFLISAAAVAFSSEQTQEAVPSPKIGSLPGI